MSTLAWYGAAVLPDSSALESSDRGTLVQHRPERIHVDHTIRVDVDDGHLSAEDENSD